MSQPRPHRHRWLTVSVFFITYSIFHAALSTTVDKTAVSEAQDELNKFSEVAKATTPLLPKFTVKDDVETNPENVGDPETNGENPGEVEEKATEDRKEMMIGIEEEEEEEMKLKDADYKDDETMVNTRENEEEEDSAIPTIRPRRSCTPPAVEQFPRPLMGEKVRKHGGLIIHILVAVYTFVALTIVCDEYFVSSLGRICEEFKLAPDVAGATFMAVGSSAPELATVVIGVFYAQDDIGVSWVIGSAVFNIMFVISVCALCAGTVSHLNWRPLCRDCFFYAVSILVMLYTISNGFVSWLEALFMLIMYGVYCLAVMLPLPFKQKRAALVTYKSAGVEPLAGHTGDPQYAQVEGQTNETALNTQYNPDAANGNAAHNTDPAQTWDTNQTCDPNQTWNENLQYSGPAPASAPASSYNTTSWNVQASTPVSQDSPVQQLNAPRTGTAAAAAQGYYKKLYNPKTAIDPVLKPVGANHMQLACWYVAYPIHWACRHTMPDCHGRWYPVTFLISMLWISFYSYFMVWMITIIGYTLAIPDTVMGLTFVAAGVSVPDVLLSLAVIKKGYGDMAISNAVGSNVFDILVCLGLPWFIQTAIILPGSLVNVISKGLIYSTLSPLSTVILLLLATYANGWKLDRKFGAFLMVWYLLFITFASIYELNIFGDFHRPDCLSFY